MWVARLQALRSGKKKNFWGIRGSLSVPLPLPTPGLGFDEQSDCFKKLTQTIVNQSQAWNGLRKFSHAKTTVTCFPAHGTVSMFFPGWNRLVFPRLEPVTCFPRAWHPLHVFTRLEPITCFPALGTCYLFSRAWNPLRFFPALGTRYVFVRA